MSHPQHFETVALIGANGAIGSALIDTLLRDYSIGTLHAFSRTPIEHSSDKVQAHPIDYSDENSIESCANTEPTPFDLIIIATGILHNEQLMPEKNLKDLSTAKMLEVFTANTITPTLLLKHFVPRLRKDQKTICFVLSARVGSIGDNRLGGWYAYRASKAALNMIIKNTAIEIKRTHKQAIIVGMHPGTVDSPLSKPFQARVPKDKLFTPTYSASKILEVINTLSTEDSGKQFAWDGLEIPN